MKLLIIEENHNARHKLWRLLCMATQNDIDMDFESNDTKYKGIVLTLDDSKDVYGFQGFLHYMMEFEAEEPDDMEDI